MVEPVAAEPKLLEPATHALMQAFAHSMRHPEPASSNPRIAVYQRLFINNVRTMLASAFPIAHALLGPDLWRQLIAVFYAKHCAQTPRFTELALEFIDFLTGYFEQDDALTLAFSESEIPKLALLELLHYEWIETELMLQEQLQTPCPIGQLQLSPEARPLAYQFAVHQISKQQPPPLQPPETPTYLLVWRNSALAIKFQTLSLAAMQLLLSFQTPQPKDSERSAEAQALIARWLRDGVLLG